LGFENVGVVCAITRPGYGAADRSFRTGMTSYNHSSDKLEVICSRNEFYSTIV
jgi:hypothetical protein